LTEYAGNDSMIAPQFKTWFYIYQGNKAEEDFKKVLVEDYLVEIKDIERFDLNGDSFRNTEIQNDSPTNSKDILQFDDLKNTEPKDDMGSIDGFDTLKIADDTPSSVQQAIADYDQLEKEEKEKVSKFDRHVDDSQYVEVPEIKKEMNNEEAKIENETDGPEKITLPIKKFADESMEEIMEMQENRNFESRVRFCLINSNRFIDLNFFSLDELNRYTWKATSHQL
jgi:hypothetical protein